MLREAIQAERRLKKWKGEWKINLTNKIIPKVIYYYAEVAEMK